MHWHIILYLIIVLSLGGYAQSQPVPVPIDPEKVKTETIQFLTEKRLSLFAKEWTEQNIVHLTALAENAPEELTKELNQVAKLKSHPTTWATIKKHPEVAGLLAGSLAFDTEGPEKLNKVLSEPKMRHNFMNFCIPHASDIDTCLRAAEAYQDNGELIYKLYEQRYTSPLPETYFIDGNHGYRLNSEAEGIFNRWQHEFLNDVLDNSSDEEKDYQLQFAFDGAIQLRQKLDQNVDFRNNFLGTYYPILVRISEFHRRDPVDLMEMDGIWNAAELPSSEKLFQIYNVEPIIEHEAQLRGKPQPIQDYAIRALLERKDGAYQTIRRCKDSSDLVSFLNRSAIDQETKWQKLTELAEHSDAASRLRYYNSLSDSALADDLHPYEGWMTNLPGYQVYNVTRKFINGQEVTTMEIILATIDGAFIIVDVVFLATGGGAAILAIHGAVNTAARATTVAIAKQIAWQSMRKAAKQGIKFGAKKVARKGFESAFNNIPQLSDALKLDVTPIMQSTFSKSRMLGMKNETFKQLSGLDARILMRSDRRVVLDLGKLNGTLPGSLLRQTAENKAFDEVMKTETAQNIAGESVKFVGQVYDKSKNAYRDVEQTWEQYASSIWLMSATGTLQKQMATHQTGGINP